MADMDFDPQTWLTSKEAADLAGYHWSNILRAAKAGTLHHVKISNTYFFNKDDVMEYASKMEELGTAKHNPTRRPAHG